MYIFFLNRQLDCGYKFGRYACARLESVELLMYLSQFYRYICICISVKMFLFYLYIQIYTYNVSLLSIYTYIWIKEKHLLVDWFMNVKHSCASHSLYFILFVLYFELISCEIDKIYNRKKVLLIYTMLRSAYILTYSNYPEVYLKRKLSMVKGYETHKAIFFSFSNLCHEVVANYFNFLSLLYSYKGLNNWRFCSAFSYADVWRSTISRVVYLAVSVALTQY